MIATTGRLTINTFHEIGRFSLFIVRSILSLWRLRAFSTKVARAIFEMGVRCTPIILTVGCFTGLVLGLQGYYTLARFGSEYALGATVGISLVTELGPVLAALMIVGQAGSAMAAELGIQRNSEQIDALETMGINPLGFLVGPRLLAALLVFPIHTAFFDLIGILGGFISGVMLLNQEPGVYWQSVYSGVPLAKITQGLVKSVVFGVSVVAVCTYEGFNTHRRSSEVGARGVSQSTTRAVVYSSITVLALDYVLTALQVSK